MKTLSAFLLTGEPTLKPNRNLNQASATKLETLARSLEKGERPTIAFTTGMGLSAIGFPERLPAIAIPTLRVMERLDALGVHDTRYTLYQAREFLIQAQSLTPGEAIGVSNHMERYIRDYIRARFPHLEARVDFDFDKQIDPVELEKVKESLKQSNPPDMQKILSYAQSKGRDREDAYTYAAANIVCNLSAGEVHHILSGGEKERPFFRLGQAYESSHADTPQSMFLIQSTGYISPYYPQGGEESYFDPSGALIAGGEEAKNPHISYDQSTL